MMKISLIALALTASVASAALAAPLTYRPMNPHISPGAFPSNVTAMNDIASLNKPKNNRPSGSSNDPADLANRSVYYGLASNITQKVLAACPSGVPDCSGLHMIDGVSYAFTTVDGDKRRIIITYPNGSTTVIDTTVNP